MQRRKKDLVTSYGRLNDIYNNFSYLISFSLVFYFLIASLTGHAEEATASAARTLAFEEAAELAFSYSPQLKISEKTINEKAGIKVQNNLIPNPVAAYSVENVFGNKHWQGWEAAESRYELSQLIELGGKRGYRTSVAQFQLHAARAGYEASKIDLLNRLMRQFAVSAAAQEQLQVTLEQFHLAKDIFDSVAAKVQAGKVSLIEQNKAEIALRNADINYQKTTLYFTTAKQKLALLWGSLCVDFDRVLFPYYDLQEPASLAECLQDVRANPTIVQAEMEYIAAQNNLHLEKSQAVPDLVVTVGYKTLQETGERGMILGAALPLPIFNRNQGSICRARAEIAKARTGYRQELLFLENKLSLAHQEFTLAYQQARLLEQLLKTAENSFQLSRDGYLEGKFEYIDMLDAQRTLFDVKERYILALLDYHQKRADILFLTNKVN